MAPRRDRLIGFLVRHCLFGVTSGVVLGGLLLAFDVAGLRTLIGASADSGVYIFMLFFGLVTTFGAIAMAVGVMQLGEERD